MTKPGWRAVLMVMDATQTGVEQALAAGLASALQVFDVPPASRERLRLSLSTAVRRVFQCDGTRSAHVIVSIRVTHANDARSSQSWGFFIVERAGADAQEQHVEVFLYPDGISIDHATCCA